MKLSSFRNKVNNLSCDRLKPILSILVRKLKATPSFRRRKREQIRLKIRVIQRAINRKCMQGGDMTQATDVATMYGMYLNQSGRTRASASIEPTKTFKDNMMNGFKKFGVSFLDNRKKSNIKTLKGLEKTGRNPLWQQKLRNKIAFIDSIISGRVSPTHYSASGVRRGGRKGAVRSIPALPMAPSVPSAGISTTPPSTSITVPPVNDYAEVDKRCREYSAAYLSGNMVTMDSIASQVAAIYNTSVGQAKILLAERCLCQGLTIGGEPCPPSDPNSPFYTTDNFCNSDWCVDGQGNPKPNAHPDCICCPTDNGGDFPCDRIPAGICNKFHDAFPAGVNSMAMQGVVNTFIIQAQALGYNLSNSVAYAILLRCCGDGTNTGNPCPPSDPNSPFFTKPNFCNSDWCLDGQGNPSPNAHPDCRCCDDGTSTGSDIPCKYVRAEGICQKYWFHMNNNDAQAAMQEVNQFALNEGISTPAAYALVLKCCDDNGLGEFSCERVNQDWCTKFHAAFPYGQQSPNMQGTVNPFIAYASGFGYTLTYDQAYDILLRCCGDGTSTSVNPCEDPNWTNLQWGGTIGQPNYPGGKYNYCDRCGTNSQGANFPVRWVNGQWIYDPVNGTNYCQCCPPPVTPDPDLPCGSLNEEAAICSHYLQAQATNNSLMLNNIITTVSNQLGLSNSQAVSYLDRCCGSNTSPCDGFQDNGCCGKCDAWDGDPTTNNMGGLPLMGQNDGCYNWCQQNQLCCNPPTNTTTGTGTNTGVAVGGVTQADVVPAADSNTGTGGYNPVNQTQTNINNTGYATPLRFSGANGDFMFGDY